MGSVGSPALALPSGRRCCVERRRDRESARSSPRSSIARYQASCPCVIAHACSGECQPWQRVVGRHVARDLRGDAQADAAAAHLRKRHGAAAAIRLVGRARARARGSRRSAASDRGSTPARSSRDRGGRRRSACSAPPPAPSSSTPARPATETIVSITVQVASVCGTLMLRYSFTSQNPPSLTCDAMSEPAPIATTSSSLLTSGIAAAIGAMMLAAVTPTTVADPTDSRSSAAITQPEHERRQLQAAHRLRDRRVHAARCRARGRIRRRRRRRAARWRSAAAILPRTQEPRAVEAARAAEGEEREQRRQQHRHERAAREARHPAAAARRAARPAPAAASSISSTGIRIVSSVTPSDGVRVRAARVRELIGHRSRLDVHAPADEAAEQRSRDDRDRKADDQRVEQRAAGVGAQPLDGRERAGMRRHQAVRGGQSRDQRHAQAQQRRAGLRVQREQHRRQQHQADLEEHRQPDDEAGEHHRPVQPPLAQRIRPGPRHHDGAARLGQQLADDGAEADHHRDEPERVADPD